MSTRKKKEDKEHSQHKMHRFFASTKKRIKNKQRVRSQSPVQQLDYTLPTSLIQAVDKARLEAGYDILPTLHNRSVSVTSIRKASSSSSSPSPHRSKSRHHGHHHHHRSFSTPEHLDQTPMRKVQFRRTPRTHAQHHRTEPPAAKWPPPPRMMLTNPRFMLFNRFRAPTPVLAMRSSTPIPRRGVFLFRFR